MLSTHIVTTNQAQDFLLLEVPYLLACGVTMQGSGNSSKPENPYSASEQGHGLRTTQLHDGHMALGGVVIRMKCRNLPAFPMSTVSRHGD